MALELEIIAPREDDGGSLGTASKQWGDVQTKKINGADANTLLFQGDAPTESDVVALIIALS